MRWAIGVVFGVGLVTAALGVTPAAVTVEFRAAAMEAADGLMPMTVKDGPTYYVAPEAILTNADIASAVAELDTLSGESIVRIVLTSAGGKAFAAFTQAHLNKPVAILVDGALVSAPVVMEPILGGEAVITGNFTKAEATRIAQGIVAGKPE